jgi:hypothetical protein
MWNEGVIYDGQAWRCKVDHYAERWYPDRWELWNFNYNVHNGTYILTGGGVDQYCLYTSSNRPYEEEASATVSISNIGGVISATAALTVRHVLYPSMLVYPTIRNPYYGVFSGAASGTSWCPTIPASGISEGVQCTFGNHIVDEFSKREYANVLEYHIGHGGTAKLFPGSFPAWKINTGYQVGNIRCHNAEKYECTTSHYSTIANEPGVGSTWVSYWAVSPC